MADKIAKMESLLDILSDVCGESTTKMAQTLLNRNIRSWDDFKKEVVGETNNLERGGNPMTPDEIGQVANKVAAKVLEEVSPSILDPAGRGMLLHFCEHAVEGSGLVVNEARARATPCNCFTYEGREYCFSKGIIGMMSSTENPEQIAEYCKVGKTYEVKPGIKERFEKFASAAEVAHEKIEEVPKGERLVPWLSAMGEELEKRGVEV